MATLEIIYEDNHIIAVNKTQHDLVQKDITGDLSLDQKVRQYLKEKYNKPGEAFLGVVHRLDRPVTGVLIFARTSKALSRLTKMFREGNISKTYWAIVKNKPPKEKDVLRHYLVKHPLQNKSYSYSHPQKNAKQAILGYKVIGRSDSFYLLEINLETGRHHQIRSQLAHIGCPVKGDLKYGYPRSNPDGGISLHAHRLGFIHPVTKQEVVLAAETPVSEKLWRAFKPIRIPRQA